jgi:hypothetical protein
MVASLWTRGRSRSAFPGSAVLTPPAHGRISGAIMRVSIGGEGAAVVLGAVLAVIIGIALLMAAFDYRGISVWVWDWADVLFTDRYRTKWGTPWRSFGLMRLQLGCVGAVLLLLGLGSLLRH